MQTVDEMSALAMRSELGYGWLIVMAVCWCLTYACFRRIFPGINRFNLPFPARSILTNDLSYAPWLIGLLGLVLRIPHLFDSLWYDETFTAALARLPLRDLPTAVLGDVHPPLPYLVQWLAARLLGTSEIALRLPSLAGGLLLIFLVYRLTLALKLSRPTALIAAGIVAVMPGAVYFSNEARGYTLLTCLAIGAAICILEDRRRLFILCAGFIPWIHNLGYLYLGFFLVAAVAYHPNRRWLKAVVMAGGIAALWLPGLYHQLADVGNGFWIPPLTVPGSLWYVMANTVSVKIPDMLVLPAYVPLWSITLLALWRNRRWFTSRPGLFYAGLVFGVPLALSLICWLWRPVYISRALLPSAVGLVILWAWHVTHSRNGWWVTGAGLLAAIVGFYTPTAAKIPIDSYLRDCAFADSAYYTDLVAWFYGSYYVDLPSEVWTGANDLNQSLPDSAKTVLFRQSDGGNLHGRVCLIQVDTPYSTQAEHAQVAQLLAKYPHREARFTEISGVFHLYVYVLEAV